MKELKVIRGGRKNSALDNQKKIMIFMRAIIILLIILIVLFIAAKFLSDNPHVNSESREKTAIDYIYEVDSDTVIDMREWKDELVILTDSYVAYVTRSGNLITRNAHKYSSPAMEIAGDKILLYDIGSTSYRMENNKGIAFYANTERPIIDASFARCGVYVFAEKGESSICSVNVYNKKNEQINSWNCEEYITSVVLSRDGKYTAYAGVSGNGAVLESDIYFASVSKGVLYEPIPFDSAVYELNYIKKDTVTVFGQGVYAIAEPDGRTNITTQLAVTENKFCYDPAGGTTAILFAKYGNENACTLQVYGGSGRLKFERTVKGNISSISCSGKYTAVSKGKSVEIFNASGRPAGSITLSDSARRVEIGGSFIYLLTSRGISIHGVNSNTELLIPEYENTAP
ncbi:MAG: hypothetical protein IJL26_11015, partial [Clostridia bacterium]|nr:hypothetical protein [Clostridia bacterium]